MGKIYLVIFFRGVGIFLCLVSLAGFISVVDL